jgi:hypothetical protein
MLRTKSWLGTSAAVVTLLAGMLAVGCGSDNKSPNNPVTPSTPPFATPPASLNGTWVTDIDEGTLYAAIDNGAFEMKLDNALLSKGTCLTSNLNFKLTITHVHSDAINAQLPLPLLPSKWYTKSDLKTELDKISAEIYKQLEERGIDEMFKEQTGRYEVNGNKLYLVRESTPGVQTFTKQQ